MLSIIVKRMASYSVILNNRLLSFSGSFVLLVIQIITFEIDIKIPATTAIKSGAAILIKRIGK